jgi:hypothetical protein
MWNIFVNIPYEFWLLVPIGERGIMRFDGIISNVSQRQCNDIEEAMRQLKISEEDDVSIDLNEPAPIQEIDLTCDEDLDGMFDWVQD